MSRQHVQLGAVVAAAAFLALVASRGASAQDPLQTAPLAPESAGTANGNEKSRAESISRADSTAGEKVKAEPEFIIKTAAQWRKILTKVQFAVTRQKYTEPAFSGKYATGHFRGTFICVCCDAAHVRSELFSSQHKFDSGTGWPSFYQAANQRAVQPAMDYSALEPRIEVVCRRCGAHLGHVFDDGPPPTGMRFCINSASIKLDSPQMERRSRPAASRSKSRAKTRAKAREIGLQ